MKAATFLPVALAVTLFTAAGAYAQESAEKPELTPEQVTTGELHVSMNSDYAKVQVDGDSWEEHEFEDNGRTLIVHRMDRTSAHKLTLTPVYPELAPIEITVKPADWKLVRLKKRVKMWKAVRKVKFVKAKKPAKKPERKTP